MKNSSNKKRGKLQHSQLYFRFFLFLFVFILIFFTGCFSNLNPATINLFNNLQKENFSISTDISKPGHPEQFTENTNTGKHNIKINTCPPCSIFYPQQDNITGKYPGDFNDFPDITLLQSILKWLHEYENKDNVDTADTINKKDKNFVQDTDGNNAIDDSAKLQNYETTENSNSNIGKTSGDIVKSNNTGSFESEILNLINQVRASKNLGPLNLNNTLKSIATSRSVDMINRSYFSHTTPDGKNIFIILQENGVGYCAAGENIYYTSPPSNTSPANAFNTWMNSGPHRANILSSNYSQIGIGIASGNNRLVITLVFIN